MDFFPPIAPGNVPVKHYCNNFANILNVFCRPWW